MNHVDTTKTITHISLCAGYGGIDIGLKRAIPNLRTVAFSEIEAFACANLVSKMEAGLLDTAPIWSNLKTFPWADFRDRVDILSGGYPCQPFSAAGRRLGTEDPRHLWPFISSGISILRPRICFFENVEGHISLGLPDVIEDLGGLGYRTTWGIFSASEVSAPHQRKRVFILGVANNNNKGLQGLRQCCGSQGRQESSGHAGGCGEIQIPGVGQADSDNCGSWEDFLPTELRTDRAIQSSGDCGLAPTGEGREVSFWPSCPGEQQYEWEPPRVVENSPRNNQRRKPVAAMHGQGKPFGGSGCLGELANGHGINGRTSPEGREHDSEAGSTGEKMVNTSDERSQGESCGELRQPKSLQESERSNGESHEQREAQSQMGGDADEHPTWMDLSRCSGLDREELAEIYQWMERTTNRTDELRMLGNGVVPATAELAFRTLYKELTENL